LLKDIERHGTGVSSVINLCDILARDTDACPSSIETSALDGARNSLEKRWQNICNMCFKRKQRFLEYSVLVMNWQSIQ